MKSWLFSKNIFVSLFYWIFLMMVLLTLSRIGFYVFNIRMFPDLSFLQFMHILKGGLVFDICAVVYINMIFIFLCIIPFDIRYRKIYQEILKYLFFITNGLALAGNGADYVYYRFLNKRATSDIFTTFQNEHHLEKMFFRYMADYWPVTLFTLLLIFLLIYFYGKIKVQKPVPKKLISYYAINVIMVFVVATLVVGAARGGYKYSTRPITISNAARYVKNPHNVPLVLNTPFSILKTIEVKELKRYQFFSDDEVLKLYDPHYIPKKTGEFKPLNIVIIILESYSREYIGSLNRDLEGGTYQGYTPFLDSLISVSMTFDVSLANGNKSIDAMPSILASMPSLETPYIISHYANNTINGLAGLLKTKGYYSAFFHGAPNGSMGFDSFSRMSGFDDYFGLDQYPDKKDFDGMWGVWDEPFFKFFGEKLNHFQQPFMASIFSVSSHHPFKVPEKYAGKFRKGPIPICEPIGYTDYSLKELFNQISKEPWFNNTLFIITADHTNEKFHKEFQNSLGQFLIPIVFFKKGSDFKGMKKRIAQQIDIMPTILNYLNFDKEFIAFGNDLLDDSYESFGFNTYGSTYYLCMKDYIMEMMDVHPSALYNYKTDRFHNYNLIGKDPQLQKLMEDKLKAIIQTYNSRMLDNNLTVKK
jgi:phosphoglycerol transferase MdoB-like AlkP superfamily enzyme